MVYEYPIRSDELYHFGVKGMKWGVRRYQNYDGTWKNAKGKRRHLAQVEKSEKHSSVVAKAPKLNAPKSYTMESSKSDSSVTKKVKRDYNDLTDNDFKKKYRISKNTYRKRVNRYGDPYMNNPLAKTGKALNKVYGLNNTEANHTAGKAQKKGLTEEQKRKLKTAAIAGAAIAGTALAAYGVYKYSQIQKTRWSQTREIADHIINSKDLSIRELKIRNTYSDSKSDVEKYRGRTEVVANIAKQKFSRGGDDAIKKYDVSKALNELKTKSAKAESGVILGETKKKLSNNKVKPSLNDTDKIMDQYPNLFKKDSSNKKLQDNLNKITSQAASSAKTAKETDAGEDFVKKMLSKNGVTMAEFDEFVLDPTKRFKF